MVHAFLYNDRYIHCRAGLQRDIKFATVVTDLTTCHNTWFHKDVDRCFVATEEAKARALKMGIGQHKVTVHGLPIRPSFSQKLASKHKLRQQLGLDLQKPAVLLVGTCWAEVCCAGLGCLWVLCCAVLCCAACEYVLCWAVLCCAVLLVGMCCAVLCCPWGIPILLTLVLLSCPAMTLPAMLHVGMSLLLHLSFCHPCTGFLAMCYITSKYGLAHSIFTWWI